MNAKHKSHKIQTLNIQNATNCCHTEILHTGRPILLARVSDGKFHFWSFRIFLLFALQQNIQFCFCCKQFFCMYFIKNQQQQIHTIPLFQIPAPPPSLFLLQANILMESWLKTWFLSPLVTLGQHERMSEMMEGEGGGGRGVVLGQFLGDVS